jgi:glycosyltransferase involved in cell wall biosynthesis
MPMTLISIILPVYNGERTLTKAIDSVIAQTYHDWELIIVNDCSTDNTQKIIEEYCIKDTRITYIPQNKNEGIQKSLNHGIAHTKGEYIARIDADDIWSDKEKLRTQGYFLDTHPAHVLVGTGAIIIDQYSKELSRYLPPSDDMSIRERILSKNCFVHASVLIQKKALDKVGPYSETINARHVEDHELWLRLGTVGMLANIPSYSVSLTASPDGITAQHRLIQAYRMLLLSVKFHKKYPRFFLGICFAIARICFFTIVAVLPFPKHVLYKIQAKSKEH